MIPYDELERALARWKARRAGTVEVVGAPLDPERTPAGILVGAAVEVRDSTSELELSDAEVHDASEETPDEA